MRGVGGEGGSGGVGRNVSWSGSGSLLAPKGLQSKDLIPGFSSLTPRVPVSAPGFLAV